MSEIVLTNQNDLRVLIADAVEERLKAVAKWFESKVTDENKILTRQDTADYLGMSLTTLYRHTRDGKITAYGIGDRVYYKMTDITAAMKQIN